MTSSCIRSGPYLGGLGGSIAQTLRDLADGYLYLGSRAALTRSLPNPALYRGDAAYLAELDRWRELFYTSHTLEELFVEGDPQYRQPDS